MSIQLSEHPPLPTVTGKGKGVAKAISTAANPIVLAVASSSVAAVTLQSLAAWIWAGVTVVFSIAMPALFILWSLRRGKITDYDVYIRQQRVGPYLFTIGCGVATVGAMLVLRAPQYLVLLSSASLAQTFFLFLVNLRWKISAHSAGMAGFIVVLFSLLGLTALPALLGIPLMVWARVRLHRHTLLQSLAGTAMGILTFTFFLLMI